ncbi:hypothetical protein D3C87_706820 [compost metagenome]
MKYIFIFLVGCLTISGCSKNDVESPDFEVSYDANKTYKVEDTVNFKFVGNAENIVFYSGMPGNNYGNLTRKQETGIPRLNFTTTLNYAGQVNTLKLVASTDFNGKYTDTDVLAAKWDEITAPLATSVTARATGNIDLNGFLTTDNKPVYLAFIYTGYNHATLNQPKWSITAFTLNNILADGSINPITTASEMGWTQIDFKNNTTVWSLPTTGLISIDGTTPATGITKLKDDNDDWAISKPLNFKRVNVETGVSIKNLASAKLDSYSYVFSKEGTYKVAFIAFNTNQSDRREILKELTITINPK